jgi:hypothetical protein
MAKKGPFSILYEAEGAIYHIGPYDTEAEAMNYAKANGHGEEFDIGDQRAYLLYPDHRMVELSAADLEAEVESDGKTVQVAVANRKGSGSHVETVEFLDLADLKAQVDRIVEEVPYRKVDVELLPSWRLTADERKAFGAIENGEELP